MVHADEGSAWDVITTVVAILSSVAIMFGSAFIWKYRDFRAFKIKQVSVNLTMAFCGTILMLSSIVSNNHYSRPRPPDFWTECSLWKNWLGVFLGIGPWLNCLILRCVRLKIVFIQEQQTSPKDFWKYLAVLQVPYLIYCIASDVLDGQVYESEKWICQSSETVWTVVLLLLLFLYTVAFLVTAYQIRNIQDEFHEVNEIKAGVLMIILLALTNLLLWIAKISGDESIELKILNRVLFTLLTCFAVSFFFWRCNGPTIVGILRMGANEYESSLKAKMHEDRMKRVSVQMEATPNASGNKA